MLEPPGAGDHWQPPRELPDLRRVGIIALDTETCDAGLRADLGSSWPWGDGYICGISVAWRKDGEIRAIYIPMRHPETDNFDPTQVYRWLKDLIASDVRIVMMNGVYDFGWLRTEAGIGMPRSDRLEEVGALAALVDENQREYSLDAICQRCGLPGKDTALLENAVKAAGFVKGRKKIKVQSHIWQLPARYVGPYAEADAIATLEAYDVLTPIIDREGTRDAYRLEVDLLPMVLEMRRRGIRINQDATERARDLILSRRDAALAELSGQHGALVGMDEINGRKWKVATFDHYGIVSPNKTAKGAPSFKAGKMGWMTKHPHWLPRLIATASKYDAAGNKFLEGHILNHIVNGRIYAEIHPFRADDGGAKSLRFSYSDPPLQQMPSRDEELAPIIRGVFLPEDDEVWAKPDVSQQEFRFVVHRAVQHGLPGAHEAAEAYRNDPDADFHQIAAEITELVRSDAKAVNFAKIFGAGVKKFAEMIGRSPADAEALYAQYDRRLPFVAGLAAIAQQQAVRTGLTRLYDGALRHWNLWEVPRLFVGAGPCDIEEAKRRGTDPCHPWFEQQLARHKTYTALNAQIQGDAARHTKLWMLACWREGIVPMLQMHDALDTSVTSREQGEMIARLGCEVVQLEVPMKVDVKYGPTWGAATHSWEERNEAAPPTTRTTVIQGGDLGGSEGKACPSKRISELTKGVKTAHNPICEEIDGECDEPAETGVCAQCRCDPPDGREQSRLLDDGAILWLHADCEDAYMRARMAEEGIPGGPLSPSPSPPPSPPSPRPKPAQRPQASPEIEFVKLTKRDGPYTKRLFLASNGALRSDYTACVMARGTAERVKVDGVAGLGAVIEGLEPPQALALGTLRAELADKVEVATRNQLNGVARDDIIARTAANIVYRGRAFALLDFDTKAMPYDVRGGIERAGGFWGALVQVVPGLGDAARVVRSSTSAGLSRTDTGGKIAGSDGIHIYITVQDGGDVERFLRALHDRCWLAGMGWMMAGAGGNALERSIVDRMVGGAEHPAFESGPILEPPLVQDRESRRPVAVEGVVVDTTAICPPLTIVERSRLEELKAKDRARIAPELAKSLAAFIERETAKKVAAGMSAAEARLSIQRWTEGILRPDVVLPFDDPELDGCTVGDVLDDPDRFDGKTMADPLEGPDYGRNCAKVMRRSNGEPWIHSFAHGRTIYHLKRDAAAVRKAMEQAPKAEVVKLFSRLVVGADLDPVELEELRQLAKELSDVGLRVINAAMKAAQAQHAQAAAKVARARQAALRGADHRPQMRAPFPDEPWLPPMGALNEVISKVKGDQPPERNIDTGATQLRKSPAPDMHAFNHANTEEDD